MEKSTLIKVRNRAEGSVGYCIPDMGNLNRQFMPNETKEITFEELQKLYNVPGGQYILSNCLIVDNKDALREVVGQVEPEYFYIEADITKLLTTESLDAFLDFLDFAPQGGIDIAKSLAVKLEINDINKREAIKKKTGFDVTKAIEFNKVTAEVGVKEEKTRRVEILSDTSANPTRRTDAPKYKVVTPK